MRETSIHLLMTINYTRICDWGIKHALLTVYYVEICDWGIKHGLLTVYYVGIFDWDITMVTYHTLGHSSCCTMVHTPRVVPRRSHSQESHQLQIQ